MYGTVRGVATLVGAAIAGGLIWLSTQIGQSSTGGYWAAVGILAGAGLTMAVSQLAGGWTKWGVPRVSAGVFLIAFLPVLVVAGWVLLAGQPDSNWFQRHVDSWSGSIAIDGVRGQTFQLSIDGSGSASVSNLSVDKLQTDLNGSGSATLSGTAADARIELDGPGEIDASGLSVKNGTIAAVGNAVVKATVTDTADVRAFGTASVEISGKPACTSRATGSATISGCD